MFDETYRALIGMNYATHGHNQIVDSLARAGIVGATGIVCYMICLSVYSVRYAKATGGLSLALFSFILMRGVSEVPLDLFGYAPDNIPHFLLLMLLAGQARASRAPVTESPATGSPLISRRVEPSLNVGTAFEGGD